MDDLRVFFGNLCFIFPADYADFIRYAHYTPPHFDCVLKARYPNNPAR